MRTSLIICVATALLAGCNAASRPVPLAQGATLELFVVAPAAGANTTPAADPATGATLHLETPPIFVTADVATVEGPSGAGHDFGLTVNPTPAGALKLQAGTAVPRGTRIAFVVNGKIVNAPTLQSPLSGSFHIATDPRDQQLVAAFKALAGR